MAKAYFAPLKRSAVLLGLILHLSAPAAWGDETRLAISGYDPVAYFTDGKPVPGKTEFGYVWHNARWRFASAAHRDLFVKDRSITRRNTTAIARQASPKEPHKDTVDPEPGRSSTASCI